jgi:hypothetical protein
VVTSGRSVAEGGCVVVGRSVTVGSEVISGGSEAKGGVKGTDSGVVDGGSGDPVACGEDVTGCSVTDGAFVTGAFVLGVDVLVGSSFISISPLPFLVVSSVQPAPIMISITSPINTAFRKRLSTPFKEKNSNLKLFKILLPFF